MGSTLGSPSTETRTGHDWNDATTISIWPDWNTTLTDTNINISLFLHKTSVFFNLFCSFLLLSFLLLSSAFCRPKCFAPDCNDKAKEWCSKCDKATHCSRECQTGDWKRHKPLCFANKKTTAQKRKEAKEMFDKLTGRRMHKKRMSSDSQNAILCLQGTARH